MYWKVQMLTDDVAGASFSVLVLENKPRLSSGCIESRLEDFASVSLII
jgi:hypothetical protein